MVNSAISSTGLTWQVVSRHGFSLKFASHNLRDDRQVVLAAVMTPRNAEKSAGATCEKIVYSTETALTIFDMFCLPHPKCEIKMILLPYVQSYEGNYLDRSSFFSKPAFPETWQNAASCDVQHGEILLPGAANGCSSGLCI